MITLILESLVELALSWKLFLPGSQNSWKIKTSSETMHIKRRTFLDTLVIKLEAVRVVCMACCISKSHHCNLTQVLKLGFRFRIDSITLFAIPASGPHGFHAIGRWEHTSTGHWLLVNFFKPTALLSRPFEQLIISLNGCMHHFSSTSRPIQRPFLKLAVSFQVQFWSVLPWCLTDWHNGSTLDGFLEIIGRNQNGSGRSGADLCCRH